MRRYHHSPSIPFHIARVECPQEPARSPVDAMECLPGTRRRGDHSDASQGRFSASRVFVGSMWLAGVSIGVGLALELNRIGHGGLHYGLFAQAAGFLLAAVSIVRHPEEYWP